MANRKEFKFSPDYAIPPGETLLETMEYYGLTQAELAERTGRPVKTINGIVKGKTAITAETSLQLERVLGVPASFWNNLESNYRQALAAQKEKQKLKVEVEWLNIVPVNDLVKKGWIKKYNNKIDQLQEVLVFFGVASVNAFNQTWNIDKLDVAYRKSVAFKSNPISVAAWIRKGELEAHKIECNPFDSKKFKEVLDEIRPLTKERPKVFIPKVTELCAQTGVAVVLLPEVQNSRVSGIARWLNSNKALIQLSARYKSDDHLWFSFYHEAGHILENRKKAIFLEYKGKENDEQEEKANNFAQKMLIPPEQFKKWLAQGIFNRSSINKFAQNINIAPGIVVGRLQYEGKISFSHFNDLKTRYRWKTT